MQISISSLRALAPDYRDQTRVFARAFQVLEQAIQQRAFPGASVAVTYQGRVACLKAFGRFTYEPNSPQVSGPKVVLSSARVPQATRASKRISG